MGEGRGAILLGGTVYPGFDNVQEAMKAIIHDQKFQVPGAVAVELSGDAKRGKFRSDFPLTGSASCSKPKDG